MKHQTADAISRRVFREYADIEKRIRKIMRSADVNCPEKCGSCCFSRNIETTTVELLPLAMHLLRNQRVDEIEEKLRDRKESDPCIFFQRHPGSDRDGLCTVYRFRPLVCRMFGFSARRAKDGLMEAQICRVVRERDPDGVRRLEELCREGSVPDMATCFMRIAGLDPMRGFRLMPFDHSLKETIEYLYWRKPVFFRPNSRGPGTS